EQDRANNDAITLQQIAVFRKARRRPVLCQPREGIQPEATVMSWKSARQERRYGLDIGFINLTAAQFFPAASCLDWEGPFSKRDHCFSLTKHDPEQCASISRAAQTGHNSNKLK